MGYMPERYSQKYFGTFFLIKHCSNDLQHINLTITPTLYQEVNSFLSAAFISSVTQSIIKSYHNNTFSNATQINMTVLYHLTGYTLMHIYTS